MNNEEPLTLTPLRSGGTMIFLPIVFLVLPVLTVIFMVASGKPLDFLPTLLFGSLPLWPEGWTELVQRVDTIFVTRDEKSVEFCFKPLPWPKTRIPLSKLQAIFCLSFPANDKGIEPVRLFLLDRDDVVHPLFGRMNFGPDASRFVANLNAMLNLTPPEIPSRLTREGAAKISSRTSSLNRKRVTLQDIWLEAESPQVTNLTFTEGETTSLSFVRSIGPLAFIFFAMCPVVALILFLKLWLGLVMLAVSLGFAFGFWPYLLRTRVTIGKDWITSRTETGVYPTGPRVSVARGDLLYFFSTDNRVCMATTQGRKPCFPSLDWTSDAIALAERLNEMCGLTPPEKPGREIFPLDG